MLESKNKRKEITFIIYKENIQNVLWKQKLLNKISCKRERLFSPILSHSPDFGN